MLGLGGGRVVGGGGRGGEGRLLYFIDLKKKHTHTHISQRRQKAQGND